MDLLNSNIVSALVGAVVGAVLGSAATWMLARPREDRLAAATYIRAISAALLAMADDFNKGEIPYKSGREFSGVLNVFEDYVIPHLGTEALERLKNLKKLAREAQEIDVPMYEGRLPQDQIARWTIEAKRAAGDLSAVVAMLEGKQHRIL